MTTSAVEAFAAPARLNLAVERLQSEDATVTDVRTVLHLLANATDVDVLRTQALLELANRVLGRFSCDVMYAPPAALNAVVAEVSRPCLASGLGCWESVQDWTSEDGYCSASCAAADGRNRP